MSVSKTAITAAIVVALFVIAVFLYIASLKPPETQVVLATNLVEAREYGWRDRAIEVKKGDIITATGSVEPPRHPCCPEEVIQPSGPDGQVVQKLWYDSQGHLRLFGPGDPKGDPMWPYEAGAFRLVPDFPYLSLVGKIGEQGRPFFVGAKGIVPDSGRLFIAINQFATPRQGFDLHQHIFETGSYAFEVKPPDPTLRVGFISARKQWQSTGVAWGTFTATGSANTKSKPADPMFLVTGPGGWNVADVPDVLTLSHRLVPKCPFMSLVARLPAGSTVCLGTGPVSLGNPGGSGDVQLAVNDLDQDRWGVPMPRWFEENEGGYIVRITVGK